MEKKMKVLTDVEITDDIVSCKLQNRFGRIVYSCVACGGGGCGCGGGGRCREKCSEETTMCEKV